jgi:NAD(P)-dependent dehydrogenase (short-subunit alcohol dehydrogenase family)
MNSVISLQAALIATTHVAGNTLRLAAEGTTVNAVASGLADTDMGRR